MTFFEAIILGIIQGVTEFLPISSTAHLTIAGTLFGHISDEYPEKWTAFIAVMQLGTMLAVLIYFRVEIWQITNDFLKENFFQRKSYSAQSLNSRLGWLIALGTLPVVVIGVVFKDFIQGEFTKNLYVISSALILLALILALAEKVAKFSKGLNDIRWIDALIIGVGQAFALIPGSSRSGTTITAGLFMNLQRETAARFSFLLSIPAVFASGLFEFYEALDYNFTSMEYFYLVTSIVFSFISGYLAIEFLLRYLRKNSTFVFIYYRIFLGLLILILLSTNILKF
ncbi:MAG: undecaprenyl-diphosphatase UppP [Ignavibacteria bacterium]|nr:undecaprenyl-diphosphatase UppP [Ignavibacteria bacterium]